MAIPDLSALFRLRPDRAADYLLAKGLKLTGPYWELDGPAHSHVFTVAHLARLDVLSDIKAAVQVAIDQGQTEKWFKDQLVEVLQRKGWWGKAVTVDPDTLEARVIQQGSLRRLQTIYRTNLQSAYMAGRHRQALEQADRAPWAQYLAVRDAKTRPGHAALHGQVFRLDSPAWAVIAPPNGYNCRCRARYLSARELAARGLKPAEDVRVLEREPPGNRPVDPLTGETPARWLQRGVSVPDPLNPGERLTLWADPNWDHLPGSTGAERALVDKLMSTATQLGDGIKEAVIKELRRNGVLVAAPEIPQKSAQAAQGQKTAQAQRLSAQIRQSASMYERYNLARDWIDDHRTKKPKAIKAHGMDQAEDMVSVTWEGITYWFKKGDVSEINLAELIVAMSEEQLPRRLTSATKRVIFSDQPNLKDAYWAVKYNDPGFVSLATGGDGTVVIYRKQPIDIGAMAHEMGHNLATTKYGSTWPPPGSAYGKAMASGEPPPTNYAMNSPAEDFAESIRLYFTDPQRLKNSAPKRYTVIKKLIESASYGG